MQQLDRLPTNLQILRQKLTELPWAYLRSNQGTHDLPFFDMQARAAISVIFRKIITAPNLNATLWFGISFGTQFILE